MRTISAYITLTKENIQIIDETFDCRWFGCGIGSRFLIGSTDKFNSCNEYIHFLKEFFSVPKEYNIEAIFTK